MHLLWEEIKSVDTSRKALRSFGWVVGVVLIGIAAFVWWRRDWQAGTLIYSLAGVGGALVVFGLLLPQILLPLYRFWMALAVVLGYVMTRVILTLVFFFVVLPIGLLLRLFGKDLLHRKLDPDATSYWIQRAPYHDGPERLERYF